MVRAGGESWFVVTADNNFGRSLERDITDSIRIAGGQVLSSVRTPSQGVTNFASFLQQARDSRAQVVALANPGVDTMNFIRQAAASGLTGGGRVKLAGLFAFITDVHALGLETAQGLVLSETFYWDLNERTRSLTERLGAMPGGPALYRYLVAANTTTSLTPDEIHNIGLSEVARILKGMDEVQARVGFKGDRAAFFTQLRTDPRFKFASATAMGDAFRDTGKSVDAVIGQLFDTLPKSPLEIRPVPPHREKTDAGGSYQGGTPDGSRPGIFYYNSYDLPSRSNYGVETLFLHEAVPGHHFQVSLAQENEKLPAFQRFGGNTAFAEGWGLYAESLGPELGMFKDPYQLQGRYEDEMLRALRLVVDTGIHSKGWGRDQSIDYMLANSSMSRTDATAEVERYIAIPGQALAYKIGQLTISRLRAKAEKALGSNFNIKHFHREVLMTGALPMAVLEAKIDRWIASGGK
jgi:uncharacterized protein (DUF885 family)